MPTTRRLTIAGLVAAAFVLAACSRGPDWTEYTYKEQRFSVAFTAPPKLTKDGPLLVEENDGTIDLGVTAQCDIVTDKTADQMMDLAIEGSRLNGTVRNITYTAIGQTMGREMLIDRAGQTTVRQRIFARDKCIYLVFASAANGPDDGQVVHFLDSFKLL